MDSYEKKYKEMKARVLEIGQGYVKGVDFSKPRQIAEYIDPELVESEDERIRKAIINVFASHKDYENFHGASVEDILAWLEKQGEHKQWVHVDPISEEDKLHLMFDGQKPADKVEPMFHEGDWVVYKNDICQIVKREEGCNKLVTVFGIEKELVNERNLSTARLWTINDAKDGDVLAEDSCTFIIKKLNQNSIAEIYCCLFDDGDFELNSSLMFADTSTYPATKEQRDTLMKAMTDAGWEFDFEKKELKKVEQKPTDKVEPKFKVGDYVVVSNTKGDRVVQIASVEYFKDGHPSYITTEGRWFGNGTKARLLTNKDVETTTIPESRINVSKNKSWSEEDDKLLKLSLENLTELKKRFGDGYGKVGDCIYWLKSVKNRIQPKQEWSEEDEAMFQGVIETEQYMLDVVYGRKIFAVGNEDIKEECTKELSWLKSLKDRIK